MIEKDTLYNREEETIWCVQIVDIYMKESQHQMHALFALILKDILLNLKKVHLNKLYKLL